jgi:hypothetical protein
MLFRRPFKLLSPLDRFFDLPRGHDSFFDEAVGEDRGDLSMEEIQIDHWILRDLPGVRQGYSEKIRVAGS